MSPLAFARAAFANVTKTAMLAGALLRAIVEDMREEIRKGWER